MHRGSRVAYILNNLIVDTFKLRSANVPKNFQIECFHICTGLVLCRVLPGRERENFRPETILDKASLDEHHECWLSNGSAIDSSKVASDQKVAADQKVVANANVADENVADENVYWTFKDPGKVLPYCVLHLDPDESAEKVPGK